jgi:flagellar biosynthetic protein FlhB
MAGQADKTEQPTPQRLKKAREDGRFPVSRELTAAVQFTAFACFANWGAPSILGEVLPWLRGALMTAMNSAAPPDQQLLFRLQDATVNSVPLLLGVALVPLLLGQLIQTQGAFSVPQLRPQTSRLMNLQKLTSLPQQNAAAVVQAILLTLLTAFLLKTEIWGHREEITALALFGLSRGLAHAGELLGGVLYKLAAAVVVWGVIDFAISKRRYMKQLRMTKQEVKEEWKQNEGSPEVKGRIRRIRRDLLRRRMMSEIQNASVVVTNPTHYAVALRYEMATMAAPRVVAKGKNFLALRIREKALVHKVPVVENKPLAQALYREVAVGQEIPPQLYRAAAEILAYVRRIASGGARPFA